MFIVIDDDVWHGFDGVTLESLLSRMKSKPIGSVANEKWENKHSGFEKPFKKFEDGKYNQVIYGTVS